MTESKHPQGAAELYTPIVPLEKQALTTLQIAVGLYWEYISRKSDRIVKLLTNNPLLNPNTYDKTNGDWWMRVAIADFEKGLINCSFPDCYESCISRAMSSDNRDIEPQGIIRVCVKEMKESHRLTYWLEITGVNHPAKGSRITPTYRDDYRETNQMAGEWATLLGVTAELWIPPVKEVSNPS